MSPVQSVLIVRRSSYLVLAVAGIGLAVSALADNRTAPAGPIADSNAGGSPLIPRKTFFSNPDREGAKISPDGKRISYLAPVNGVLNVWVGPADDPKAAKPVTNDTVRGIRNYFWAYTNNHIIYMQDKGGDENWRVYAVDLTNNQTKDLTPLDKVAARVQEVSRKAPDEILVALNDRNEALHDIHRVNIRTGERKLVIQNPDDVGFVGFTTDDDYNVRFGTQMTPEGGITVSKYVGGKWEPFQQIGGDDALTTGVEGVDRTGTKVYMIDSRGRNTAALTLVDIATGKGEVLAENPKADLADTMAHPTEKTVQAAAFNYERKQWQVLDKAIEADLAYLRTVANGDFQVVSRSLDDQRWVVRFEMDNGPVRFYLYDRPDKSATFLFTNRQALEGLKLANMSPVVIKSRDGLDLVSYLTLPVESAVEGGKPGEPRASKPLPMVLLVHGGPWSRDEWGYDGWHQWLANRGYAVLSVNFRGSTGLGKNFTNAGDKEWGTKMHTDLLDAVKWATDNKIADPNRVAIVGGSYGGYAALWGMTNTPDEFACGVSIVGPSNLNTLLGSIPPYWAPMIDMFARRVGDNRTAEGRALLEERSPLNYVDRIKRPLLIGQGANDPRVKQAESEQIVTKMKQKNLPVTYVLFPDEGHGFARPENNLAFNAIMESFLGNFLGGRIEPIGQDCAGSSIMVPEGGENIAGLTAALPKGEKKE